MTYLDGVIVPRRPCLGPRAGAGAARRRASQRGLRWTRHHAPCTRHACRLPPAAFPLPPAAAPDTPVAVPCAAPDPRPRNANGGDPEDRRRRWHCHGQQREEATAGGHSHITPRGRRATAPAGGQNAASEDTMDTISYIEPEILDSVPIQYTIHRTMAYQNSVLSTLQYNTQ